MRIASQSEINSWDERLAAAGECRSFFQMEEFAQIKATVGWRPRHLMLGDLPVLALEQRLPLLGKLWYLPQGPAVTDAGAFVAAVPRMRTMARQHGVFALKCEPVLERTDENIAALESVAVRGTDVQPTFSTVILDIAGSMEDIEKSFESKTRYNVRQGRKNGIECRVMPDEPASYDAFLELYRLTAADRFTMRDEDYLRTFWTTYVASGHGLLMGAWHEGRLIAADFVLVQGHVGNRKDAGSVKDAVRGGPALLVLETIRELQQRGVDTYDLCGAPESWNRKDPEHPLHGVGTFKQGFGSEITDLVGTWEIPVAEKAHRLWQAQGERLVRAASFRLRGQPWY